MEILLIKKKKEKQDRSCEHQNVNKNEKPWNCILLYVLVNAKMVTIKIILKNAEAVKAQ